MAITFTTEKLQGLEGTAIAGVYARIQSVTVKKYDATTDPDVAVQWKCLYDVVLHGSAVKRNAAGESPTLTGDRPLHLYLRPDQQQQPICPSLRRFESEAGGRRRPNRIQHRRRIGGVWLT